MTLTPLTHIVEVHNSDIKLHTNIYNQLCVHMQLSTDGAIQQ